MATEPLLALDELLQPIPGEDPAGESVPFTVRAEMEEARKEVDPEDFSPDDPLRPAEPKKADWAAIVRSAVKALSTTSKDLLVAARLTEALTKRHGFAGLAEGLRYQRRLIEECWDRLHPVIEDGDLEVRAGPFNWLGDDGRGARFPHSLRTLPLFEGEEASYSQRDWRLAQEGKGKVTREAIEKAINAASREHCNALVESILLAQTELTELVKALNQKLGSSAPAMLDVRKALDDVLVLAREAQQRKGGPPVEEEAKGAGNGEAGGGQPARPRGATREDLYQRLAEVADLLEKMEPHSPVPYLVRRAVAWGSLPFPQLMKALLREDYNQAITEMNRELGIKEPPPE
jgi:type VI secretion system protein ImpA